MQNQMKGDGGGLRSFLSADRHNFILWILGVTIIWYIFISELIMTPIFGSRSRPIYDLFNGLFHGQGGVDFTVEYYLSTIGGFLLILVYTRVTKRNRFIFRTFLPSHPANTFGILLLGLLVGFAMNFGCILCAMANGDIHLYLSFVSAQIPLFLFALVCVFIQSSAEELWTRGFIYERINVHYPLWVAILINGVFFGLLHIMNPGVGFLPILDICICGISFSLAKWYTGSIWFPMGIHTGWNFTQNFLFGLPNSGLISEESAFALDAASARDSLVYNVDFGVEGAIPAVLADGILGIVCLLLAWKKGRLGELKQRLGPEVMAKDLPPKETVEVRYVYSEEFEKERMKDHDHNGNS